MNLTAMKCYSTADCVDAVVIGTEAGGAPLLARLAAAGLSVVALEAGQNWTPEEYPADEVSASGIYWLGERLSAGDTPNAFGANNSGMGVGGSTLHWGAFCPRADPRDLRMRTEQGAGEDWPIRYEDLLPYYERVEASIGVSGPASYPWDPSRRYPLPPVPRNASAQMMNSACSALGVRCTDGPAAVVSRNFVQNDAFVRPACINCGYCHQGCRIGAKTSMDVTYLPLAVLNPAEIGRELLL
jgi:choline dehydrogenase-like flavoprotein